MNILPRRVSDHMAEKMIFIGASVQMLKTKKIDHLSYSRQVIDDIAVNFRLKQGELDELPQVAPCDRFR